MFTVAELSTDDFSTDLADHSKPHEHKYRPSPDAGNNILIIQCNASIEITFYGHGITSLGGITLLPKSER